MNVNISTPCSTPIKYSVQCLFWVKFAVYNVSCLILMVQHAVLLCTVSSVKCARNNVF